jgi:60 kDa SS-A/Ro ribonucleoprotein
MARTNTRVNTKTVTHESGAGRSFRSDIELKRTAATCLLFEPTFYERGNDIADRLASLASKVKFKDLADTALWTRKGLNLRHVSLYLAVLAMQKDNGSKRAFVGDVIQRADEMAEMIALYWKVNGKDAPLAGGLKKGIADAFGKFDEYQLGKWDSRNSAIRLRDVMFLTHPKPSKDREDLYNRIAEGKTLRADTWEKRLSAGQDKGVAFSSLLAENKLGAMALLRNLRNMVQSNVDRQLILDALSKAKWDRVLPYRFASAVKHAPEFGDALDKAFIKSAKAAKSPSGNGLILVDVSGSMDWNMSEKSDIGRVEAAATLAAIAKESMDDTLVYAFENSLHGPYLGRGLKLVQDIDATPRGGTRLGGALRELASKHRGTKFDYLIVITDEQAHDSITSTPDAKTKVMVNVAPYKKGVAIGNDWLRVNGWSEKILDFLKVDEDLLNEI